MSRASTSSQRNLTLTEELEKLEQSITLTLQGSSPPLTKTRYILRIPKEIDHNFSRAHRIVTTSILPVVEQYAEHSKNVWESSKVTLLLSTFVALLTAPSPKSSGNNFSKPRPTSPCPDTKSPRPKTTQSQMTPPRLLPPLHTMPLHHNLKTIP